MAGRSTGPCRWPGSRQKLLNDTPLHNDQVIVVVPGNKSFKGMLQDRGKKLVALCQPHRLPMIKLCPLIPCPILRCC